jgi:hypothetical protein
MAAVMPRSMPALRVDIREKWFAPVGDAPAKRALGEVAFAMAPGDTLALNSAAARLKRTSAVNFEPPWLNSIALAYSAMAWSRNP